MIHSRREGIENERPVSDLIIMYVFCFCMPSFGRGVEAPAVLGPPLGPLDMAVIGPIGHKKNTW